MRTPPGGRNNENSVGIALLAKPLRTCIRPISGEILVNFSNFCDHLERRAVKQSNKFCNPPCERALRMFQIFDACLEKMKKVACDSMVVSILTVQYLWKNYKHYFDLPAN